MANAGCGVPKQGLITTPSGCQLHAIVMDPNRIAIPTLVRIKPGALARMGTYLSRFGHRRVAVFQSARLLEEITGCVREGLRSASIDPVAWIDVQENDFDEAVANFTSL